MLTTDRVYQILLIEDNPTDANLVKEALQRTRRASRRSCAR